MTPTTASDAAARKRKERSLSAGEELWLIHCQRSHNRADEDAEEEDAATAAAPAGVGSAPPPARSSLSLRNREVVVA